MLSKVWDSAFMVCKWIVFGISVYLLFTGGFTDRWRDALVVFWLFECSQRIRALEKKQESQTS
jgi:hypothetical protein